MTTMLIRPEQAPAQPVEPVIRHPENMRHEHLDRMFHRNPHLLGTRVARISETLREGLVWGV